MTADATTPAVTAELVLHQLVLRIGSEAPEAQIFPSEEAAQAEAAARARTHLEIYWGDYAGEIIDDSGLSLSPSIDLATVTDPQCLLLAEAWDGAVFETVIRQTRVDMTIDALVQALRTSGLAVCVFQPSDVAAAMNDDDRPAEWLLDHSRELESVLALHGNAWIDMSLEYDGRDRRPPCAATTTTPLRLTWRDEDYGACVDARAAFRATPAATREEANALSRLYVANGFDWNGDRGSWITYDNGQATKLLKALQKAGYEVEHAGCWPKGPPCIESSVH